MKQALLLTVTLFLLPAVLLKSNVLSAQVASGNSKVSVQQAQTIGLNFFKVTATSVNPHIALSATLKYTQTSAHNTVAFYVFDINPGPGFVIVAANENVTPVLAYSTEQHFNTGFRRLGVNNWMHSTAENIYRALKQNTQADARISTLWSTYRQGQKPAAAKSGVVTPMVATLWDQESAGTPPPFLYNLFCPYNSIDTQRCLTGCVATAMAQIMKHWNYPAHGTGFFSYADSVSNGYSYDYGNLSANFGATTYDWTHMPVSVNDSTTGTQDSAVAVLMYQCAVSVGMDFGDDNQNGSGAEALQSVAGAGQPCAQYAFANYFSYNPATLQGVYRSSYSPADWLTLIEGELTAGRPVLYEGDDSTQGGHAWVCDGFDANDMFHMNWGWSGVDNGYFAVTNFTTSGNYNPILNEEVLIGIEPLNQAAGIGVEPGELAFNIYPNPAKDNVTIEIAKPEDVITLSVKNILGQTLLSKTISNAKTMIDVSIFPSGFYVFELSQAEKSVSKKIIINR